MHVGNLVQGDCHEWMSCFVPGSIAGGCACVLWWCWRGDGGCIGHVGTVVGAFCTMCPAEYYPSPLSVCGWGNAWMGLQPCISHMRVVPLRLLGAVMVSVVSLFSAQPACDTVSLSFATETRPRAEACGGCWPCLQCVKWACGPWTNCMLAVWSRPAVCMGVTMVTATALTWMPWFVQVTSSTPLSVLLWRLCSCATTIGRCMCFSGAHTWLLLTCSCGFGPFGGVQALGLATDVQCCTSHVCTVSTAVEALHWGTHRCACDHSTWSQHLLTAFVQHTCVVVL